jgi:hypothetical protein
MEMLIARLQLHIAPAMENAIMRMQLILQMDLVAQASATSILNA